MKRLCERIRPVSVDLEEEYQKRLDNLTKPAGSLGRLEEIARRYAAIRHPDLESVNRKYLFTFASDHGVSRCGVSLYPREVTVQMVYNFLAGGAAINVLCRHFGIENVVVDVGVDFEFEAQPNLISRKVARGTANFLAAPAMTQEQAEKCVEVGFGLAEAYCSKGAGLIGTGEMGIGNTTSSSAVFAAVTGLDAELLTGSGTGINQEGRRHKVAVVRQALELHRPEASDPLDILSKVGGFEIGAIMGLVLGSASNRVPVVVDGFISTAGAALALQLCPAVKDYLFFSHCSYETGHRKILEWLGARALFDLDLRLGEGTGAALAMDLITVSIKLLTQMATFETAKVSRHQ